jgi:hypothetical protein
MLSSLQFVEMWKQLLDALSTLQLNGADICWIRIFDFMSLFGLNWRCHLSPRKPCPFIRGKAFRFGSQSQSI